MHSMTTTGFVEADTRIKASQFTPDPRKDYGTGEMVQGGPVWTLELRGSDGDVVLYFRDVDDLKRMRDAIDEGLRHEGLEP